MDFKKIILPAVALSLSAGMAVAATNAPMRKAAAPDYKAGPMRIADPNEEDPTETWTVIGEGMLRDDIISTFYFSNTFDEFPVQIAESNQNPGRYRVLDPYANYHGGGNYLCPNHDHFFTIDATDPDHVWIEKGCLGINIDGQEYVIWSVAAHEYLDELGDWEEIEKREGKCWGVLRDGAITFPANRLLTWYLVPPYDEEGNFVNDLDGKWTFPGTWKLSNSHGMFRVKLPGAPDYDVTITEMAPTAYGDNKFDINFQSRWGEDVAYMRVGMVIDETTTGPAATALLESLNNGGGKMIDDSTADMFGNITWSLPHQGDGRFVVIAVPFNDKNEPKTPVYLQTEISLILGEWREASTQVDYTEAIFCDFEAKAALFDPYYDINEETFKSTIQVNMGKKGMFRLVDPYKNYSWALEYDDTHRYYMVINAVDPEFVHIERMDEGVGFDLIGTKMHPWSRANRALTSQHKTKDQVKREGTAGRFDTEEGTITMPEESMLLEFAAAVGTFYYANNNGGFKIQLTPEAYELWEEAAATDGIEGAIYDSEAPAVIYNLQGVKVDGTTPGVYVERRGNVARKIVVK